MADKPMTRKARERARHRQEILDAAEQVFARRGFHAASMAEIAKRAEFAVGTLYLHFKTKEDVYLALIERKAGAFAERLRKRIASTSDPIRGIATVVEAMFEFFEAERDFLRIHLAERARFKWGFRSDLSQRTSELFENHIKQLSSVIRAGIASGLIRKGDPRLMTIGLSGFIHFVVADWAAQGEKGKLVDRAPQVALLILGGLATARGRRKISQG